MPELPEVETVKRTLEHYLVGKRIEQVTVYYPKIIANQTKREFEKKLEGEVIESFSRRGKWLIFHLTHLRMEGKYFMQSSSEEKNCHEHVVFSLSDGTELRYQDTRKFGRMYLFDKGLYLDELPLRDVGYEPWSESLTESYLKAKFKGKRIPIKTTLLDQSIIAGIGNIYADEILFKAHIHPLKMTCQLTKKDCTKIIEATRIILEEAISMGGTTIRSYESEKGVHGRFQQQLLVHNQTVCQVCSYPITRIVVGGRSTYFCGHCQKKR